MAFNTSLSIVVSRRALETSTMGDSPVTVTVSSRPPTFISASIAAVNVPVRTMSVNAVAVRHRVAHFLDEDGAACFDGDTREHRSGSVFDGTRDDCLSQRDVWDNQDTDDQNQDSDHCSHQPPLC